LASHLVECHLLVETLLNLLLLGLGHVSEVIKTLFALTLTACVTQYLFFGRLSAHWLAAVLL
jgi:hypothetical protein